MDRNIMSVFGGLGGMLGWGTSDFFASRSSENVGYFKTFFWSQCIGLLSLLVVVPFIGVTVNITGWFIVFFAIASVIYSAGYLLFYKGFELGNVSVVSSTINLYAVFTMIFSYIFLGQRLSLLQVIAVLFILGGVTLVSLNFKEISRGKFRLLRGVKETIVSAAAFGVFWTISDVLAKQTGWVMTTMGIKIGSIITLLLYGVVAAKTVTLGKVKNKTKYILIAVGVLDVIGTASVNFGLTFGDAILVTPISTALSVVTISLAIVFLKEKITTIQAFGIFITLCGIVMTAL